MKHLIITLMLMFGAMQSQAFVDTLIKAEIIASEVSDAVKKTNNTKALGNSVQLIYLWQGEHEGRKCSCIDDNRDAFGLPVFSEHSSYCDLCGWVKSVQSDIVPSTEFNLVDALNENPEKGTLVLAYKLSGCPDYVYTQRAFFEEPDLTFIPLFVGIIFSVIMIACVTICAAYGN